MLMDDSGIDSGDKMEANLHDVAKHSDSDGESDIFSKLNEFDVVFKSPTQPKPSEEHQVKHPNTNQRVSQVNTCKILQRKLELKVERAKRNYKQMYDDKEFHHNQNKSSMIPISRLSIPGCTENQRLVEYNSGNSDDENDNVTFFPIKNKKMHKKQELSDTFSIQEMTIESDDNEIELKGTAKYRKVNDDDDEEEDEDDSQNLELLPPTLRSNFLDKMQNVLCCFKNNDFL